uniref:Uncharacterized protein n=1 Tax=Arundo donax TaxID=35708 RepID=A0A0A8XNK3_ARUDO
MASSSENTNAPLREPHVPPSPPNPSEEAGGEAEEPKTRSAGALRPGVQGHRLPLEKIWRPQPALPNRTRTDLSCIQSNMRIRSGGGRLTMFSTMSPVFLLPISSFTRAAWGRGTSRRS